MTKYRIKTTHLVNAESKEEAIKLVTSAGVTSRPNAAKMVAMQLGNKLGVKLSWSAANKAWSIKLGKTSVTISASGITVSPIGTNAFAEKVFKDAGEAYDFIVKHK